MKQIFSYLIPYRARMAVGFSIKVAATIVELLIPWALSIMVDKVIPTENIGFVFAWGGVMILFAILALLGNIVANRMASLVARNTTERIRLQLFSKISFLSARQQEQIGQASLISRSTSDTYNIHQFIGMMQRLGRASAYHAYRRSCSHAFNGCAAYMYHAGTSSSHGTSCIFVFK